MNFPKGKVVEFRKARSGVAMSRWEEMARKLPSSQTIGAN
jgi:hypothetical protein